MALALANGGSTPIAYSIAALCAWALVLTGVGAGFFPRSTLGTTAFVAGACLVALATITGLSAIWASDAGAAFDEAVLALGYAGLFVLVVAASRHREAAPWLAGLAIGLALVALLALGARLEPSLFGDGERELIERLPVAEGRLSDPFQYWNALAAAMATGLVLLAWASAAAATRALRAVAVAALPLVALALYMTTSRGGAGAALLGLAALLALDRRRIRLAGSLAVGLAGAGAVIAFASTRNELLDHPLTELAQSQAGGVELVLLAAVIASGALAYAIDPILGRLRAPEVRIGRRPMIALGAAAALVAAALIVAADPAERWEEFKEPPAAPAVGEARDLARAGSSGRYQFWETALDAFDADPLKGVGAAGYEAYWNQHGSLDVVGPNGHSLLFDTAGELGLLGLAAVLGFGGVSLYAAARRVLAARRGADEPDDPGAGAHGAAVAILLAGFAGASIDWLWENPAAFAPIVIAAALLTGPATETSGERPLPAGERRTRRRFAGGVSVLGFAWVAICASALLLLTNLSLNSSRDSFAAGDLESAADSASNAIDVQPWAAQPHQQLGLVLEAQGDIPGAEREIGEAIERAPEDWRLWLVAARLARDAGDEAGALADAGAARALAPRLSAFDQPLPELVEGL